MKRIFNNHQSSTVSFYGLLAILLLIIVARGSLPFMQFTHVFLVLFIVFSFFVRYLNRVRLKWENSLIYVVCLSLLYTATSIFNNSYDNEFRRYILYAIIAFVLIGSFTLNEFKKIYLNAVTIVSIISIFIFVLSQVVSLPLQYIISDTLKLGHFYYHTIEWNNYPIGRNASFFSEPGCFQYCLNYTLLLFVEDIIVKKLNRRETIKLGIVIIALLTCASTTGYIVLMVLITFIFFKIRSKHKFRMVVLGLPFLLASLWWFYNSDSIKGKFEEQNNETASFVMRRADALAMIQMINPIIGNGGVDTKVYKRRVLNYGALTADHGASNGVLVGMATMGVGWLFLYMFFCHRACKKMYKFVNPWLIVLLILLIHTNEFYIFCPIVYVFLFPYHQPQTIKSSYGQN